jgi:hypothetical protein
MQVLIYNNYAAAQADLEIINQNMRQAAIARGQEVDEDGNILPVNAKSGMVQENAAGTSTWDVVHNGLDSKFFIIAPKSEFSVGLSSTPEEFPLGWGF